MSRPCITVRKNSGRAPLHKQSQHVGTHGYATGTSFSDLLKAMNALNGMKGGKTPPETINAGRVR